MEKTNQQTGLGIGMILFLIFLTLKLGQFGVVATWSWWWVFSPIWIPIVAFVITLGILIILNK